MKILNQLLTWKDVQLVLRPHDTTETLDDSKLTTLRESWSTGHFRLRLMDRSKISTSPPIAQLLLPASALQGSTDRRGYNTVELQRTEDVQGKSVEISVSLRTLHCNHPKPKKETTTDNQTEKTDKSAVQKPSDAVDSQSPQPENSTKIDNQPTKRKLRELRVSIISASGLRKADTFGKSDPYVKLQIATANREPIVHQTKTIDGTSSPRWNETFVIPGTSLSSTSEIQFTVFDEDIGSDDYLASTALLVAEVAEQILSSTETVQRTLTLQDKKAKRNSATLVIALDGEEDLSKSQTPPREGYTPEDVALLGEIEKEMEEDSDSSSDSDSEQETDSLNISAMTNLDASTTASAMTPNAANLTPGSTMSTSGTAIDQRAAMLEEALQQQREQQKKQHEQQTEDFLQLENTARTTILAEEIEVRDGINNNHVTQLLLIDQRKQSKPKQAPSEQQQDASSQASSEQEQDLYSDDEPEQQPTEQLKTETVTESSNDEQLKGGEDENGGQSKPEEPATETEAEEKRQEDMEATATTLDTFDITGTTQQDFNATQQLETEENTSKPTEQPETNDKDEEIKRPPTTHSDKEEKTAETEEEPESKRQNTAPSAALGGLSMWSIQSDAMHSSVLIDAAANDWTATQQERGVKVSQTPSSAPSGATRTRSPKRKAHRRMFKTMPEAWDVEQWFEETKFGSSYIGEARRKNQLQQQEEEGVAELESSAVAELRSVAPETEGAEATADTKQNKNNNKSGRWNTSPQEKLQPPPNKSKPGVREQSRNRLYALPKVKQVPAPPEPGERPAQPDNGKGSSKKVYGASARLLQEPKRRKLPPLEPTGKLLPPGGEAEMVDRLYTRSLEHAERQAEKYNKMIEAGNTPVKKLQPEDEEALVEKLHYAQVKKDAHFMAHLQTKYTTTTPTRKMNMDEERDTTQRLYTDRKDWAKKKRDKLYEKYVSGRDIPPVIMPKARVEGAIERLYVVKT
eukprot:TRINITY_DN57228_c0_g1_i1.p1 TRINITY_DN57228_c0_g1~~TRINITY_DN57228_c0_g1_i1.p1  ORF type:complete len:987 (+),score=134.22 TRINITY_DN57228_c0_g1_i1:41-2962(+)